MKNVNAISQPIHTYFTRWQIFVQFVLTPVMGSFWGGVRFAQILIVQLVKYVRFRNNCMNLYEWGRYELATSYELPWDRADVFADSAKLY